MKKLKFLLIALLFVPTLFLFGCGQKSQVKNTYEIEATYNDVDQTLSCSQRTTYHNCSENALESLSFFLYPNAFQKENKPVSSAYLQKAYPNGESYGNITFQSVKINGEICETSLTETQNILRVKLFEKLFPTESVCVDFEYVVKLSNINHRLGFNENTTNFGGFFPIACVYENGFVENDFACNGDPFYSEISDFEVKISFPNEYILSSSGEQTKFDDHTLCKAENVRDFCFVLSKKFEVLSCDANGVTVNYFYYDDEDAQKHLQTAKNAVLTFSKMFGQYPYKQLSVVKCGFCFGGMEYPNLVMISDAVEKDVTYDYVIVHEIAHQWWYGMVGNNEFSESFIDESLTEYSTLLFFEENKEYGIDYSVSVQNAIATYKSFVKVYSDILGKVDQSMKRNLTQFETEPEYVNCIYTKGVIMFDCLRQTLGDKKFFKCLKNYFEENKFQNVNEAHFVDSFSKSANRNLEKFFSSWLSGKVIID